MNQEIDCSGASGAVRLRVQSLPFSAVPGQSKLFLDFLADPASLSRFFPNAVRSHTDLVRRVPEVLQRHAVDRDRLCDALLKQNTRWAVGAAVLENIKLLRRGGTVAVVTGQQAGLFGGPLYTIYKALSAISAAACLRNRGVDAVPIFWAATEDHDFDEVSATSIAGITGDLVSVRHIPSSYTEKQPVGSVALDEFVSDTIDELFSHLPPTEFTAAARLVLESAYGPSETFGTAFARLMSRLFAPRGLIVVDPLDGELKRLAAPMYRQAVTASKEIVSAITARGAELKSSGYHTQVEVGDDYFPLFGHDSLGRRAALRSNADGTVRLTGSTEVFTLADLVSIAEETPERLSPGVMLRPVVQDYLFPTLCYFGGAAEIAYFAQNSEAYRLLERPVTPILHRQSFTVVEARFGRNLEKLRLGFADLFDGFDALASRVTRTVIDPEASGLFADVEGTINAELRRLDEVLSAFDGPLAESFANRRRKIVYHLAATRAKYERRRLEKSATVDRRLRSTLVNLMPRGGLQERHLNVMQFLDRYGDYFIDWLYQSVDLDDKGHRVIYL